MRFANHQLSTVVETGGILLAVLYPRYPLSHIQPKVLLYKSTESWSLSRVISNPSYIYTTLAYSVVCIFDPRSHQSKKKKRLLKYTVPICRD